MKKSLEDLKYQLEEATFHLELLQENGIKSVETVASSNPYNKEKMLEILLESLPKEIEQLKKEIAEYAAITGK